MSDELELLLPRSSPRLAGKEVRLSSVGPGKQQERTPAQIPKKRLQKAEELGFLQKPAGEVVQKSRQQARINRALLVKHLGVFKKPHAWRNQTKKRGLEKARNAARQFREKTRWASKRRAQKQIGAVAAMVGVPVVYSCYSVIPAAFFSTVLTLTQEQSTEMIMDAVLTAGAISASQYLLPAATDVQRPHAAAAVPGPNFACQRGG